VPPCTPAIEALAQRMLYEGSLSVVAQTELLSCCTHTAALQSGHSTSILPVSVGTDPTPVTLAWRLNSAEARRAVQQRV
jgi:hypothetical protein